MKTSVAVILLATLEVVTSVRSPVEKVVELIEELKAMLEEDHKANQQVFDKFACWCETMTGKKAAAIHQEQARVEELGTMILELKGKVAVLSSEIAELTADIAENEEKQKEATSIRSKENAEFVAEKSELEQAIGALEKAVHVLASAGGAGLLQSGTAARQAAREFDQLKVMAQLRSALRSLPERVVVTPKQLSAVERFTRSFEDPPEGMEAAKGSYSPASATIQGILKDMYDTFSADMETRTETEAKSQKNFEDLIATKMKALRHMQSEVKTKNSEKAEAEVVLADASQELDDTTKQMKADIEFFDLTKSNCKSTAEAWGERSKAFTEEKEGIDKALEILTSDDAKELFGKAIKPGKETFLQLSSESDVSAPAMKAYQVLKKLSGKTNSLRLATLAATIRMATGGHFDKVIEEIDKIIVVMKDEAKEDIKQRDWCTKEYFENSETKAEVKWLIEKNEAAIVKLEELVASLTETLEDTAKEITNTEDLMKKMTGERKDENDDFLAAKKDDEDAIALLEQAVEALGAFYKNNKIELGPIQGSGSGLIQEPEFDMGDKAPDADFQGKGANKNQSKGIISILTMLVEDLKDEVSNGIKNEVSSQVQFEKEMDAAKKLVETLTEKKVNLETDITNTNEKREAEDKKLKGNTGDLATNEEYKTSISPDCEWMTEQFENRKKKRTAEMDGLVTAKEFLAGAGAGFLQRQQ